MSARDEAIRLLSAHLQAAACLVDAMLPLADPPEAGPDDLPVVVCACGEAREAKLEETPFTGEDGVLVQRVTCLSCGRSFSPEVSRG